MASQREAVVAALEASDVVVVGGETGSGKTTQVCWWSC
jgi:HrpA-like RNA helicase